MTVCAQMCANVRVCALTNFAKIVYYTVCVRYTNCATSLIKKNKGK